MIGWLIDLGFIIARCFNKSYRVHPVKNLFHTSDGLSLTPEQAFHYYTMILNGLPVPFGTMYKDVFFDELLQHDEKLDHMFVLCGYLPKRDEFLFIKYARKPELHKDGLVCAICLEDLNSEGDFPCRYYGPRCFHDVHMKCMKACREHGKWVGNCCNHQNYTAAVHMVPVILSKQRFCDGVWRHICEIAIESRDPRIVYDEVNYIFRNEAFVPFSKNPYSITVDQFHPKWMTESKALS